MIAHTTDDPVEILVAALATNTAPQEGWHKLGEKLDASDRHEAALAAFEASARSNPGDHVGWFAVATMSFALKRPKAALAACNKALALVPDDVTALFNVAVVLEGLGDLPAARHCYEKVLKRAPTHRGALLNMIPLLSALGEAADALLLAREAVALHPSDPDICFNFGDALLGNGDFETAREAYQLAAELCPSMVKARIAAAVSVALSGSPAAAREALAKIAAFDPLAFSEFRSPLPGDTVGAKHRLEPGRLALVAAYEQHRYCHWGTREQFVRMFQSFSSGSGGWRVDSPDVPFLGVGLDLSGETVLAMAQNVAARIERDLPKRKLVRPCRTSSGRLRIGYMSGDFRQHATACLMSRLPGLHDREKFEVFVYSNGPDDGSALRAEIINGADQFCDVSRWNASTTAQRILYDGIDILVDLSGYTLYAKTEVLAYRPAPIQVSYLTYLQTQGALWIDYALLDRYVLLPVERGNWLERIAYFPDTLYICNDRVMPPPAISRTELGLPESVPVLACFNAAWKIDPETFSCWMEILRRSSTAVLWLYDDTGQARPNLIKAARAAGIDVGRLFFADRTNFEFHLRRMRSADIFLDTFSCNGHTTVIEALSAGLPVLTKPGRLVPSRVAASLLAAHHVPELIADDAADYVERADRFINDLAWREIVRAKIARREGSNLFCTSHRVREIESAYIDMWNRHSNAMPPADFDVTPVSS